jgi:hypothetical protein
MTIDLAMIGASCAERLGSDDWSASVTHGGESYGAALVDTLTLVNSNAGHRLQLSIAHPDEIWVEARLQPETRLVLELNMPADSMELLEILVALGQGRVRRKRKGVWVEVLGQRHRFDEFLE